MIWDGLGNRLQQFDSGVLTQRTFNAANEMLTIVPASGTPTTQIFDPNGNLRSLTIGAAITTNSWSPENRLLSQISPTVNEQYQYGQDGLRRQKISGGATTNFTLDGVNVLLETTGAGALQAKEYQLSRDLGWAGEPVSWFRIELLRIRLAVQHSHSGFCGRSRA